MAEITPNLIHIFKEKHAHPHKPPFVFGLRTGYVRAWVFVTFKVLFIVALLNGVNTLTTVEKNLSLLDSYVRDDFSQPEVFFDELNSNNIVLSARPRPQEKIPLIVIGEFAPRGPMPGEVASAVTNSQ